MAFNPLAGTAGRFKCGLLAPDLSVPIPSTAGVARTIRAGIRSWKIQTKHEGPRVINFESAAYANGSLAPAGLQGGITEWTVRIEGEFDGDLASNASSASQFYTGSFLLFDLVFNKGSGLGRPGCVGKVMSFDGGPEVKSGEPQMFSAEIEGSGLLPDIGIVP